MGLIDSAKNGDSLEKVNQILEKRIEHLEREKYTLKKQLKAKSSKKSYFRVTWADSHGYYVDEASFSAFISDLSFIKPKIVIGLGDHLECGGFLAQHHTIGYVAETPYTYDADIMATNHHLDLLQETVGRRCILEYIEGNHERRIERWCVTQALASGTDADRLLKAVGPESVLHLGKRGINYYRQSSFYDGLHIPGTIKRGKCCFTHGRSRTSVNEARAMLAKFNCNVVFGHTHRADESSKRTIADGLVKAWNPGCLCKERRYWQHTDVSDWCQGYGLQLVHADGTFLHISVPIINGVSYLNSFINLLLKK